MNEQNPARGEGSRDPYPGRPGHERVTETCGKCSGTGRLVGFEAIDNGRCWSCGGTGTHSVLISSIRARLRRQARREAETAQAQSEAQLRLTTELEQASAALIEAHPPFADALDEQGLPLTALASAALADVRGGVPVAEVIQDYRWRTGEILINPRPNRYPTRCHECRAPVLAGEGQTAEHIHHGWLTHCSKHAPITPTSNER